MRFLYYLLFFWANWVLLMLVFRLTTYHRTFLAGLPILIGLSGLAGYLFWYFHFDTLFFLHLVAIVVFLTRLGIRDSKQGEALLDALPDDRPAGEVKFLARSLARTRRFYVTSSIVHVLVFAVMYLYFFNISPPPIS